MIWSVAWSPVCDADVRRMPYRTAERICMAVIAFARDGSGMVERNDAGDLSLVRIRARGGFALVHVDPAARRLAVSRIIAHDLLRRVAPLL